ncbi:DUF87 domain-containing protein [Candidatus Woesearchaeota archaeon]|nr:DUF87 domain-containing protein [Candidatus Woesearchaeota archaeon]
MTQQHNFKKAVFYLVVILLAILSVKGLLIVSQFVGHAVSQVLAGRVYEVNLEFRYDSTDWAGAYGAMVMDPAYTNQQWTTVGGGDMVEQNLIFECLEPKIQHEVYASQTQNIDWNTISAGTPQLVDLYMGYDGTEITSAANTFTQVIPSIELGTQTINNIPAARLYKYGTGQDFLVGVLRDGSNNIVYVVQKTDFQEGFNDRIYNYQYILPVKNNTNATYYFFADPNDNCPSGIGVSNGTGSIDGNVTTSIGLPIDTVIIMVRGQADSTDLQGHYHIDNLDAGEHVLVALKTGFEVYYANVTINNTNTTYHNIILLPEQNNIGPGQTNFSGPGQTDYTGPGKNDNIGPNFGPFFEEPKELEGQDFVISIAQLNRFLHEGQFMHDTILLYNLKNEPTTISFRILGNASSIIDLSTTQITIPAKSKRELNLTIFGQKPLGIYNGTLYVEGAVNGEIPIYIEVSDKERLDVQALLLELELTDEKLIAGKILEYKTVLRNLLSDKQYPIYLFYTITDRQGNIMHTEAHNVFLKTSITLLKNHRLPKDLKTGDYILRVQANYLDLASTADVLFQVTLPFYKVRIFGLIEVWKILLLLFLILAGLVTYFIVKRRIEAKKRYHLRVEYDTLPGPGPRSIFGGKIAETDHKTYFNMENFKTHTIIAGSTGGGKSVSAQVIIEEMLNKDVAVIVFDPTAQWSGMLRKCTTKSMIELYPTFGLKKTDAKAFNGNIRQITDAREIIDIKKYIKPGEIQIFACHKLDPKDMDIYVANAIREVFHANFDEFQELRLMVVFDEVHRLLPKFGGSGEGFLQIERGCREFRKWGIGIMLISQVLSDFVGQIKANINTEIQMRTRDEGDLERIATKYGKEVLQSLVKAQVGSGMVENPAYNRGKPYFVAFRPLLHSVQRLTDEELEKYNQYNEIIDQVSFELEQLEKEEGQDVFDMKLELKLALDKVKSGNFNMVEIYLEGLTPRIKKLWDKIGKKPKKLEKKLVDVSELKQELDKAKEAREKYESEEAKKEAQKQKETEVQKEVTTMDLVVPFDKALNFNNGATVTALQELIDALGGMSQDIFVQHVNDEKNEIADWIEANFQTPKLTEKVKAEKIKDELLARLMEESQHPTKVEAPKEEPKAEEKAEEKKDESKIEIPQAEPLQEEKQKAMAEGEKLMHQMESMNEKSFDQAKQEHPEMKTPEGENVEQPTIPKNESLDDKVDQQRDQSQQTAQLVKLDFEKQAPADQYFKLENGQELKSINELYKNIDGLDDGIFDNHVTEQKNDFASWIEGVFGYVDLAEKLRGAHDKGSMKKVLEESTA